MLLESKLGYLYTDFDSNSDVMPFSDHLFTKMALKSNSKVLVTTSANGSVNILVNAEWRIQDSGDFFLKIIYKKKHHKVN